MKERRISEFLDVKDYYTINENGEIYSDNSGLMKTRNKGKTQKEISELFNCTRSNISYILNNKTWQV